MYDAVPRDNMLSYVLDFTEVEGYGLITSKGMGSLSIRFQEEVEELHLAALAQTKDTNVPRRVSLDVSRPLNTANHLFYVC